MTKNWFEKFSHFFRNHSQLVCHLGAVRLAENPQPNRYQQNLGPNAVIKREAKNFR